MKHIELAIEILKLRYEIGHEMNLKIEDKYNYYMLHILYFTYIHILIWIPNNYMWRERWDFGLVQSTYTLGIMYLVDIKFHLLCEGTFV